MKRITISVETIYHFILLIPTITIGWYNDRGLRIIFQIAFLFWCVTFNFGLHGVRK